MFEKLEIKGRGKTYIGYDLGAGYGEISVFTDDHLEPVTLLSRKDAAVFHFPCMLAKYQGRFYAGFEAAALAGAEGAVVFEDLLELAMNQPFIVTDGQRFDTKELLGLFLKLTLCLPEPYGKVEKAGGIIFTTYIDEAAGMQKRVYEVLTKAAGELFGKKTRIYLQTRSESIYYFLMHQEESLYREDTLVCDYQKEHLKTYFLQKHGKKAPFTVSVERREYPDMKILPPSEEELTPAMRSMQLDSSFCQLVAELESRYEFGLSYMLGDGFKGNWLDKALDRLYHHGRVFQGNNLYSLGACYCLRQLLEPSPVLQEYVFWGSQEIRFDIGIYCSRQGVHRESLQPEYIVVFQRGTLFEQCRRTLYLMPEGEEELVLEARALSAEDNRRLTLDISSFPKRKAGEGKLKVSLEFTDCHTLAVTIEDVGLGNLVPASEKMVYETICLE